MYFNLYVIIDIFSDDFSRNMIKCKRTLSDSDHCIFMIIMWCTITDA